MLSLEEILIYATDNYGNLLNSSLLVTGITYALETAYDSSDSITMSLVSKFLESKEEREKAAIREILSYMEIASTEELEEAQELIIERDNKLKKQEPINVKVYRQRGNNKWHY